MVNAAGYRVGDIFAIKQAIANRKWDKDQANFSLLTSFPMETGTPPDIFRSRNSQ